ncbi:MAG TPA: cell division protein [Rhodospirillales bacterium]|nr:cell division protein [Rhodospirillales bacterium]
MLTRRTDLQLERDALGRFLPWQIAFMVYLAALALAGAMVLNATMARWNKGISGVLTVQIAPLEENAQKEKKRIKAALEVLGSTPGVIHAESIGDDEIMALLEPWLGSLGVAGDLPLPHLIDVELEDGANLDMADLSRRLEAAAPGASIDDHRIWLKKLIRLMETVKGLAVLVVALVCLVTVGTVAFTTRTGLAIHQDAIEVLHHIGAQDSYIAKQFASRVLVLGLKGGGFGLAMAVASLLGVGYLASRMETGVLPAISLSALHWAALIALPLAVAMVAMLTARMTVTRSLNKMM